MNISNTSINKISAVPVTKITRAYQPEGTSGSQADSLDISKRALEVSKALNAVKAAPEVRADKVAQAASKLQDGTLQVSSSQIAQRMLGDISGAKE